MVQYRTSTEGITASMLTGFFVGWPNPPDSENHLRILKGSAHVVLAMDSLGERIIGFITAVSDGVSAAYIPHLEVLPEHQGVGIGRELVKRMVTELKEIYMIDLMCDEDVVPFYQKLGMNQGIGMYVRNYHNQPGLP